MTTATEEIADAQLEEADQVKEILASGADVGLRKWNNEEPTNDKESHSHSYETVGYVLKGKARLHLDGKVIELEEGSSYLVPKESEHRYEILETFTALEATSPPAHLQ